MRNESITRYHLRVGRSVPVAKGYSTRRGSRAAEWETRQPWNSSTLWTKQPRLGSVPWQHSSRLLSRVNHEFSDSPELWLPINRCMRLEIVCSSADNNNRGASTTLTLSTLVPSPLCHVQESALAKPHGDVSLSVFTDQQSKWNAV